MSNLYNVSTSPHVRNHDTTSGIMRDVVIALLPASAFGVYNFGLRALLLIIISVVTCVASEAAFQYFLHKKVTVLDFSAVVTGILIALNVPSTLPIGMLILGCVFAIIVVKQLFGGLGQNFMNPALAARGFLIISFTKSMATFTYDGLSGATPLAILKCGSESVGASANLFDMFIGTIPGTIGETSVVAILLGALYLVFRKVITLKIPLTYLTTFALFILVFAPDHQFDLQYMAMQLCGGGLMLGAFFMATDYVTSPITSNGKIVFGILLGVLTGIFRLFGASAEGVSYAIIFANLLVPLIEKYTSPTAFGKTKLKREVAK